MRLSISYKGRNLGGWQDVGEEQNVFVTGRAKAGESEDPACHPVKAPLHPYFPKDLLSSTEVTFRRTCTSGYWMLSFNKIVRTPLSPPKLRHTSSPLKSALEQNNITLVPEKKKLTISIHAYKYRIYSINRPGRLLHFWTLRVGAYSRPGAY